MLDISATLKAKSDQLNADDLLGGPIVVQITRVELLGGDQPVAVHIGNDYQPWKPCKSQRRLLARLMGTDASQWVGRWVELYNEPTVTWAGQAVGGIRMSGLSDIPGPQTVMLMVKRGRRAPHTVKPIDPPRTDAPVADVPPLDDVLDLEGIDPEHFDAYMRANGSRDRSAMDDAQRARAAAWLMAVEAADKVRSWKPDITKDPIDVRRGQAPKPSSLFGAASDPMSV